MPRTGEELVTMARSDLLLDHAFFGILLLSLTPTPTEDLLPNSYAATDGKRFFYDPKRLERMSLEEVKGILCHEVLHAAFGHTNGHSYNRSGGRDPFKWNIACDAIINYSIRSMPESQIKLPPGCVDYRTLPWKQPLDKPLYDYVAEELYARLPDPQVIHVSISGDGEGEGAPGCGLMDPKTGEQDRKNGSGGSGPKKMSDVEKQIWQAKLKAAAEIAKRSAGTLPAGIEEIIKELRNPKVNWLEQLIDFIQRVYEDYAWNPPDRRTWALAEETGEFSCITALTEGERLSDLVIAVDTSGSISHEDLVDFVSEVNAIATVGINLWLCYCDANVQYFGELTLDNIPQPSGRGGTDFQPVFDRIEAEELNCEGVVFFTDGYPCRPHWAEQPDYEVMWVVTTDVQPPWGGLIKYPATEMEKV